MHHNTEHFTGHDRLSLFERSWMPPGPIRAAVVFVHGLLEHSGRHANMAAELARQGYAVHAMDLRGHGLSEGRRGDVRSFDQYLLDLDVFFAQVRARHGDRPIFLMGNSMGGLIAALWSEVRKPPIAGLVLTGPLLALAGGLYPRLRNLTSFFRACLPFMHVPRIPYRLLSRNHEAVLSFRRDPLVCRRGFTVRAAAEALRALQEVSDHASLLSAPLLILHGGDDRICGVSGSRLLYARAGSADKTLNVYDGLYHELFDEPESQRVLADLLGWLNLHVGCGGAVTCPKILAR
jgi:acylglycerol lipase